MEQITFADGSTYPCTFCGEHHIERVLFVALNTSFAEAAAVLSDESKTQEITYAGTVYRGYTEILGLTPQPYGPQAALHYKAKEE